MFEHYELCIADLHSKSKKTKENINENIITNIISVVNESNTKVREIGFLIPIIT